MTGNSRAGIVEARATSNSVFRQIHGTRDLLNKRPRAAEVLVHVVEEVTPPSRRSDAEATLPKDLLENEDAISTHMITSHGLCVLRRQTLHSVRARNEETTENCL
jgi:hypothetical protein